MQKLYFLFISFFVITMMTIFHILPVHSAFAVTEEWPTSLHDIQRTASSNDTTLSASNAAQLSLKWSFKTGGVIAASPTVVNNTVYVGSWDGYMYALDGTTGALKWKTFLGITTANPICIPPKLGISSTATVQNGVVYVGGGDANWYSLDASSGAVLWSVPTGDNSASGGHYNWSSPLLYNGFAYIGIASLGDCPLVQGLLLKVDLNTHAIVGTTKIVPDGQVGGGIWQSPSLDTVTNKIFVATGTENSLSQTYAQAMLAIDANTMQIVDSWKLPESQAVTDSDFSTTAILFTDANNRNLVAAINKNGSAYAFDRNNLSAGPVWQKNIALGSDCPTCGASSVSSPTFMNGKVFFSGAGGVINGYTYRGTVRAVDPATGNYLWQYGATGSIIPAITSANGLIFDSAKSVFEVLNASTGDRLFSYDTGMQIYSPSSIANGTVYTGNLTGNILAFGLPATPPPLPPPDQNCPNGFTCQDIGNPSPQGSETVASGIWNIQAGGSGVNGSTDSFRLMTQTTSGNIQVSAQITTSTAQQTGVMLRQSNDPASQYYSAFLTPNNKVAVQYRKAFGGTTTVLNTISTSGLPLYIAIQRIGDTFQAATSSDGNTFTIIPGTTTTFPMPTALLSGLAVGSGTNGTTQSAIVANVVISSPSTFQPQPSANPCPAGWKCQDIGNPITTGDQNLSGSTFTVKGAGDDIWAYNDTFHYVWQTISADATISARVVTQTNSDPNAKAGLMMRLSTDSASAHYSVFITPSNGILVQYRDFSGFNSFQQTTASGSLPQYLQIARSGNTFTAYTSSDGNNWSFIPGSTITINNLSGTIMAGMAVTSHNNGTTSTVTYDSVNITNFAPVPPTVCPANWNCEDIGFPTPSGSQTLTSTTWNIYGGGGDIWGTIDSFRFVYQNLAGDGTISARIKSQSNTNAWAKGGIMLRLTNDQSAPYYSILTTPANGTVIQYRLTQGGSSNQLSATTSAAPLFVKIGRTGTTYSASISPDGNTWTQVPGSSVSVPNLTGSLLAGMAITSHNTTNLSQVVFDNVSITNQTVQSGCPANWTCTDIGSPVIAGSTAFSNNTFTVNGAGNDIWQTTDQFQFAYQPLNGDGTIIAQVTSQTNTNAWAKAGVMMKESASASAKYVFMGVTPGNGLHMQYNFSGDISGGTYTFPVYIKLNRSGNVFTAYSSTDGTNWVQVGSTSLSMNTNITAGLFVTSHNGNQLGTATFTNVSINSGNNNQVPSPWADTDIGQPAISGSASYVNGTFTVNGAGNDIWGSTDQFNYVNQSFSGDGSIIARVTSQTNTNAWAKAGVMIKEATVSASKYVMLSVTPGNGIHMQYNFTGDQAGGSFTFPNAWLKVTRTGNTFTTAQSSDGINWTTVGSTTLAMNTNATIGLFVCSHNGGQLGTAIFDNVTITTAGALPSGWSNMDIGSPALGGSSSYNGGTFTINGAGNDIWQTTDQFQYTYQSINGDATISARMLSQTNTSSWAKAGVMIKQAATALSPYVWFGVTPGNGMRMQYNFTGDQSGGAYIFPQWIRLSRAGNIFTSYISTDGTTWTKTNQTTLTLNAVATAGLFVTSHNGGQLGTATFDNVTITHP